MPDAHTQPTPPKAKVDEEKVDDADTPDDPKGPAL
jgi:hypothetical protein